MNEFFQRLKQRKLVQWAIAYVAAAFALLQGIDIIAQQFAWPEGVRRGITLALVVGFFVTLILAWYHGERGAQRISGTELLIIGLVLALGGGFLWRFAMNARESAISPDNEVLSHPGKIPEKSIAVLPFDNLSDDKSNGYFAEGIQDEILTRLSKIAALKVISRTSTQKYKGTPDNLREVGKELGVANILEGSVQKIANAVHVNVQLIRAATDEHIWADSYNRKLDDVFAVEGEVASAIADQLNAELSGTEQKAVTDKPTQNAAAYDAYLRALSIEHNNYNYETYSQAERGYEQAVELDPSFAIAWARLTIIRSFLYFNAIDLKKNSALAVREAADRAMALAPEAGESWIALGAYRYRVERDFEGALSAYNEAQKRMPNSALVYEYRGFVLRRLGRWQEAEVSYKHALELDPRDIQLLNSVGGEFYNYLRRIDDALAVIDRALAIAPDSSSGLVSKAAVLQSAGRLEEARKELSQIPPDAMDDWVIETRVAQAIYERKFDKALTVIEQKLSSVPKDQPLDSYQELFLVQLGQCQEWLGSKDAARDSFARAVQAMKPRPETVVGADANGTPVTLALAYAGLNEKEKALEQAQEAVKSYDTDAVAKPGAQIALAQIQARFGDLDSAIAAIPHLLAVPAGVTQADLKFNPLWDPVRKDPRFQRLTQEK